MFEAVAATEAAYRGDDLAAAWDADMAFHATYCRMSGNGRLLALFDSSPRRPCCSCATSLQAHASLAWTPPVELHRHIAQAIADRDAPAASAAVIAHYQYTQDRLQASAGAPAQAQEDDASTSPAGG